MICEQRLLYIGNIPISKIWLKWRLITWYPHLGKILLLYGFYVYQYAFSWRSVSFLLCISLSIAARLFVVHHISVSLYTSRFFSSSVYCCHLFPVRSRLLKNDSRRRGLLLNYPLTGRLACRKAGLLTGIHRHAGRQTGRQVVAIDG